MGERKRETVKERERERERKTDVPKLNAYNECERSVYRVGRWEGGRAIRGAGYQQICAS